MIVTPQLITLFPNIKADIALEAIWPARVKPATKKKAPVRGKAGTNKLHIILKKKKTKFVNG